MGSSGSAFRRKNPVTGMYAEALLHIDEAGESATRRLCSIIWSTHGVAGFHH